MPRAPAQTSRLRLLRLLKVLKMGKSLYPQCRPVFWCVAHVAVSGFLDARAIRTAQKKFSVANHHLKQLFPGSCQDYMIYYIPLSAGTSIVASQPSENKWSAGFWPKDLVYKMRENNQQCRIPPPPGLQKAAQISKVGKFKPSPRFIQVMLMRSMPLEKLEKHIKYLQTEPLTSICIVFIPGAHFFVLRGRIKVAAKMSCRAS